MLRNKILLFTCFSLLLGFSSYVFAEDSEFKVKNGFYVGLLYVNNSIDGDFNDDSVYYSSTHVYNVPEADSGGGFGLILGSRFNKGAFEFGYQQSKHETHSAFVDVGDQDAEYNLVDMNFKFDVFAKGRLRPNIILGLGYTWLDIENNKTDGQTLSDERFTGWAANLGAGLAYFITPQWCINGALMYRWQSYGEIDGNELEDSTSGSGVCYNVGMAYTF